MFEIIWSPSALKRFKKLETTTKRRIRDKLQQSAGDPEHFLKHLTGVDAYELRVGKYRLVIDLNKSERKMFVLVVGHKKEVSKKISF